MSPSDLHDCFQIFSPSGHKNAPLQKAISSGDADAFQKEFCRSVKKARRRFKKATTGHQLSALWSASFEDLSDRERELAGSIIELHAAGAGTHTKRKAGNTRKRSKHHDKGESPDDSERSLYASVLIRWLQSADTPLRAWESTAVAEILLRDAEKVSSSLLVRTLSVLCQRADRHSGRKSNTTRNLPLSVDVADTAVQTAEADWCLSLLLDQLVRGKSLRDPAAAELNRAVLESTDSDGLLHGSFLRCAEAWLIPQVRASAWAHAFHETLRDSESESRFSACIERLSLLLIPGAEFPVSQNPPDLPYWGHVPFAVVLRMAAALSAVAVHEGTRRLLTAAGTEPVSSADRRRALRGGKKRRKSHSKSRPASCWQSDQSCQSIMRSTGDPIGDLLLLEWHGAETFVTLAAGAVPFLNGPWKTTVQVDGILQPQPSGWICTCWFLDDEAAFVELEAEGCSGYRLIRQALLMRTEHAAILTDSVTSDRVGGVLKYRSTLDLSPQVLTDPDRITREIVLRHTTDAARAFPVWLEDDRVLSPCGSFSQNETTLEMTLDGHGGVTLPLLFDWNPQREDSPADWNRLTVAESRRNVTSQEAAGFRIRIGKKQWVIYRSLNSGKVARTVLGLHTAEETVYGRVNSDGDVEAVLLVEPTSTP